MLKLENVSTYDFLVCLLFSKNENERALGEILQIYEVYDYQRLEFFIMYKPINGIDYSILEEKLKSVKKRVARTNELGIEPQIYLTNNFFSTTDADVKGKSLILANPIYIPSKNTTVAKMDINTIKHLLSYATPDGKNALTYVYGIGNLSINKIYNAVLFYDAQVSRQAKSAFDYEAAVNNLFEYNIDEKTEELVAGTEPINYSLEYILDTAATMIWGPLTDSQKVRLNTMVKMTKEGKYGSKDLNEIFDVIRNYVTLEEVQKGLVKTRTIDRFIKEKNKNKNN